MTRREDLAWVAGFLDGEGHYGKKEYDYPFIVVVQVEREPLERRKTA